MKEGDLVYELGLGNWLDTLAGEAVLLGQFFVDPELCAKGTRLSLLIREIPYNSDRFCLVQVCAEELQEELRAKKEANKTTIFIDELYYGTEGNKSCLDWEYDFLFTDGRYQIKMNLPKYFDKGVLRDKVKVAVEARVRSVFDDPSFEKYEERESSLVYGTQNLNSKVYSDNEGRVLRKIVDFNHEGGEVPRGLIEYYYFDEYETALRAWIGVREVFISGQKR